MHIYKGYQIVFLYSLLLSTEIMELKGDEMVVLPCDMQYHVLMWTVYAV